jgi:hypothetical protein
MCSGAVRALLLEQRFLHRSGGVSHTVGAGLSHTGMVGLSHTDFVVAGAPFEEMLLKVR